MLAAELALHKKRGGNPRGAPAPDAGVGPTSAQPLTIDQLHSVGYGGGELRAMSLPAHNHFINMTGIPPKPRVRPSPSPSLNLADLPILELPEPSVGDSGSFSSSLAAPTLLEVEDETVESAHVEESGGTCVASHNPPARNYPRAAAPPAVACSAMAQTSGAAVGAGPCVTPLPGPPVLLWLPTLLPILLRFISSSRQPPCPPLPPGRFSSCPLHGDRCRLSPPPPRPLACCGDPTPEGESHHSHPHLNCTPHIRHGDGHFRCGPISPTPALSRPTRLSTPSPAPPPPRPGRNAMGGRTPSSTILEAMQQQ